MSDERDQNEGGHAPRRGRPGRSRFRRDARGPRPPAPFANIPPTPEPDVVRPVRELLEEILQKIGIREPRVVYYARSEGEYLEINGPDLGSLIGRHGQTLEALNLVFNNIINANARKDRHYYTIDAEGYRARRADVLKGIALQSLERAIRERRPVQLEPMLPSERKVIHLALADNPFVTTESTGVEPERRVVVSPRAS